MVQLSAADGTSGVRIVSPTNYLIVPDFFADDLVYDAQTVEGKSLRLPAENFYLQLTGDGQTVITCIWGAQNRTAKLEMAGEGEERFISGSEVECRLGDAVWVAVAEHPNMWHSTSIAAPDASTEITTDWVPPFSAKWRGDFWGASELAVSASYAEDGPAGDLGTTAGETPRLCEVRNGSIHVRLSHEVVQAAGSGHPVRFVTYPIDRTVSTPLDLFLLVDVMRGTLGTGPCQYILDIEGLDADSSPTPALVCEWIEKQYKKQRGRQGAQLIQDRLDAMTRHVEDAERRIAQYIEWADQVRRQAGNGLSPIAAWANGVERMLGDMERAERRLAPERKSPEYVKELAVRLFDLGQDENWEGRFRQISSELHVIGSAQDRTLATCRMSVRRLRQYCLTLADEGQPAAASVVSILSMTEHMLRSRG
jgi:hypothetical protein